MIGADHAGYTDRFHELAKLVPHLVTPETKCVTRYINGLPSQIRGMLRATQPATILTAGILTDEVVRSGTLAKAVPPARENENFPKCARCKGYHARKGPCRVCYNFQRPGHIARDCRSPVRHAEPIRAVRPRDGQKACYECGSLDHLRPNCPRWNQGRNQYGNKLALTEYEHPRTMRTDLGEGLQCEMLLMLIGSLSKLDGCHKIDSYRIAQVPTYLELFDVALAGFSIFIVKNHPYHSDFWQYHNDNCPFWSLVMELEQLLPCSISLTRRSIDVRSSMSQSSSDPEAAYEMTTLSA
ncbi:putative reverse transcriptase domain-containing protein [Tanacetum coccineum]